MKKVEAHICPRIDDRPLKRPTTFRIKGWFRAAIWDALQVKNKTAVMINKTKVKKKFC